MTNPIDPTVFQESTTAAQDNTNAVNDNTDSVNKNIDATTKQTVAAKDYQDQIYDATQHLKTYTGGLSGMSDVVKGLTSNMVSGISQLGKVGTDTAASLSKFSLAITAATKARDAFAGTHPGLNLFSAQFSQLVDTVSPSTTALQALGRQLGVSFPEGIDKAKNASSIMVGILKNAAMEMFKSADNASKLTDVYIKSAAAAGRWGDVQQEARTDLSNLNKVVADQRAIIDLTAQTTNISIDDAESYYQQLARLPVVLKDQSDAIYKTMGAQADFNKVVLLAKGIGMDTSEVIKTMHAAITDYNASIPEAIKFTEQISEISRKYGIELEDVQKALVATGDAFKFFGADAGGAAMVLNSMVQSLKNTGLSGAVATDVVSNMTRQISQLSIAQKAFLSAQQGGPGGLMGAFQIDQMLRGPGGIARVFDMVRNQMTRMMGPLVSTAEAAQSPAAAARLTRQIMMLQQGPLGQLARTPQEAERIIEAMKTGRTEDIKPLMEGQEGVKQATELGSKYAQQTSTDVSEILSILREAQGKAAGVNLNLIQSGSTAAAGAVFGPETDAIRQSRMERQRSMTGAGARVQMGLTGVEIERSLIRTIGELPERFKASFQGAAGMMTPEGSKRREDISNRLLGELSRKEKEAQRTPEGTARTAVLEQIRGDREAISKVMNIGALSPTRTTTGLPTMDLSGLGIRTPGQQIGTAIDTSVLRGGTTATGAPKGQPSAHPHGFRATETAPANFGEITVQVEGFCLNCGMRMKNDSQNRATSVTAAAAMNK